MKNILWNIGYDLKLVNITHAKGCFIYDADCNSYLDMVPGVWCTPLGHYHPEVNQAVAHQMANIMHIGYCYAHPVIQNASQSILEIIGFEDRKCLFLTSGSEAVKVGIKAIKTISPKPLLLTFSDSFLGSLGSSGTKPSEEWFLFDWAKFVLCSSKANCDPDCPYFSLIPFEKISGFVFEPRSFSVMVRFPPEALITSIVSTTQKNGGFVQINEITTGMGRTGKWFEYMHMVSPLTLFLSARVLATDTRSVLLYSIKKQYAKWKKKGFIIPNPTRMILWAALQQMQLSEP